MENILEFLSGFGQHKAAPQGVHTPPLSNPQASQPSMRGMPMPSLAYPQQNAAQPVEVRNPAGQMQTITPRPFVPTLSTYNQDGFNSMSFNDGRMGGTVGLHDGMPYANANVGGRPIFDLRTDGLLRFLSGR